MIFARRRTKLPRLQPPRQLETLDDLLAQAAHYANFCMRNSGKMAPALFLIGADGPLMFAAGAVGDEAEKDGFANTARLLCLAHAATACVLALESWMKLATPGEELDMTERPSEAFDRQEVIVLMGEAHTGLKQKYLTIIRSDNGKFFGFGELNLPVLDKIEGRFAQILPPKGDTAEHRLLAQAMLKIKGISAAETGGEAD